MKKNIIDRTMNKIVIGGVFLFFTIIINSIMTKYATQDFVSLIIITVLISIIVVIIMAMTDPYPEI